VIIAGGYRQDHQLNQLSHPYTTYIDDDVFILLTVGIIVLLNGE
jgi:hypothetical protein